MSERLKGEWIDTAGGVIRVGEAVRAAGWVALDTEADSMHSYFDKVCLIQVTADGRHFLIDPLALETSELTPLLDAVSDPALPVIMHGADYDIRILDRDFDARVCGLRDTQIMAQLLGEARTGLANLLAKELGVTLAKEHQLADWGRRPLAGKLLAYAVADTVYLGPLFERLKARLEELGRWSWAVEEFRALERVRHQPPREDPAGFERVKGARKLKGAARDRLFTLYRWRDEQARRRNVPPFKVLGNRPMLRLASDPPADLDEVAEVNGLGAKFARRSGRAVLRALERPKSAPPRRRGSDDTRRPRLTPAQKRRVDALRRLVRVEAERLGLDPGLLCPRAQLEAIASASEVPSTGDELAREGLTGWRLDELGGAVLKTLRAVDDG